MNSRTIKNLFFILSMLASLGSCLGFERNSDRNRKICKPLEPFVKMFEAPENVLIEVRDALADIVIAPRHVKSIEEALEYLVSGEILAYEKLSEEQVTLRLSSIAEKLVKDVRENLESKDKVVPLIQSAVRETIDLAIEDFSGQIKEQLNKSKVTSISNYDHLSFLKAKINNYIVSLYNSKEIDIATYDELTKALDLDNNLKDHEATFSRILNRFKDSLCLFRHPKNSLFALLNQLLGEFERNPTQYKLVSAHNRLLELTNIWIELSVKDGVDSETEQNIQYIARLLLNDIYEIETKDLSKEPELKDILRVLKTLAPSVLNKFASLKDTNAIIQILKHYTSYFLPSISCDNFAKNFKNILLHPDPRFKEILNRNGESAETHYDYLLVAGSIYYSAEKETDPEVIKEIIEYASWIIDFPLNKKDALKTLMPLLCDSDVVKFSENDLIFQTGLVHIGKVISGHYSYNDDELLLYAQDFNSVLSSTAYSTKGVIKIYAEFLRLVTLFKYPEFIKEIKLYQLVGSDEKSIWETEIAKKEFEGLYTVYVNTFKLNQKRILEAYRQKADDFIKQYLEANEAFNIARKKNDEIISNPDQLKSHIRDMFDTEDKVNVNFKDLGYSVSKKLI